MRLASASSLGLGQPGAPSQGTPQITGHLDGNHILVPLLAPEVPAVTDQLRVAASLARTTDASLHLLTPITLPDQTPQGLRHEVGDDDQAFLEWALDQVATSATDLGGVFLYTRNVVQGVLRTVRTNDIDTLVIPGTAGGGVLRRDVAGQLALHADCDVVTVNGRRGYESVPSILLPVAGGPHTGLATDVAQRIAADCEAWIDVLHVVDEDASARQRRRGEEYLEAAYQRIARPETTTTRLLEAGDVAAAIAEQSKCYELTVIGAPTKGRLQQFVFGSTSRSIRADARSVVLSARAG